MPATNVPPPPGSDARFAAWWADLCARPHAYELFQALRHIELAFPDMPRFGTALRPADEPVRIGQSPELGFATGSIHRIAPGQDGGPPQLVQNVFGLIGINGPLPMHITELARERAVHHRDHALQGFLDMLGHRFTLLFYRAWAQAQPVVGLDRSARNDMARWLGALFGLHEDSQADRDAAGDAAKLVFCGRLGRQVRDADGLLNWCRLQFAVPLRVLEWCGHWLPLATAERSRMTAHPHSRLGQGATLGQQVWDVQHKFRLEIGPLRMPAFRRFLPGGPDLARLHAMVRQWLGLEFAWDVRLVLDRRDVPQLCLGGTGSQPLGRTTWLGHYRHPRDAGDLLMDVEAVLRPRRRSGPSPPPDHAGDTPVDLHGAGTGAAIGAAAPAPSPTEDPN